MLMLLVIAACCCIFVPVAVVDAALLRRIPPLPLVLLLLSDNEDNGISWGGITVDDESLTALSSIDTGTVEVVVAVAVAGHVIFANNAIP
jgi:hypothetical protein